MKILLLKQNNLDLTIAISFSIFLKPNKLNKEYKNSFELSIEQKECLIGLILGDVCIEKGKRSKNARLRFEQSIIHKEYLMFLYNLFEPLVNMKPKIQIRKKDFRTGKIYKSLRFATLSMPCLNYYYNLFYSKENNKKMVPLNICDLLTARSLAYWIMDDGGKGTAGETYLHTRAFTLEEINLLRKTLKINFNLNTSAIEKVSNQWIIRISLKQKLKLIDIVKPYMHDSMLYKV